MSIGSSRSGTRGTKKAASREAGAWRDGEDGQRIMLVGGWLTIIRDLPRDTIGPARCNPGGDHGALTKLHPARESLATLRDIRQRMGEYHFPFGRGGGKGIRWRDPCRKALPAPDECPQVSGLVALAEGCPGTEQAFRSRTSLAPAAIAAISTARTSHWLTCPTHRCDVEVLAVVGQGIGGATPRTAAGICAALKNRDTERAREDVSQCGHGLILQLSNRADSGALIVPPPDFLFHGLALSPEGAAGRFQRGCRFVQRGKQVPRWVAFTMGPQKPLAGRTEAGARTLPGGAERGRGSLPTLQRRAAQ